MKHFSIYKHLVLLLMLLFVGTGQALAQEVLLGDANNDGVVNGDDVTLVINCLHDYTTELPNRKAANANCDNNFDIADVTAIVNIINYKTPDKSSTSILFYLNTTVEKTFGNASFTPNIYRAGSTGAITYARTAGDEICTVNATTGEITITGAGSCTITATLAADDDYSEATASFTLSVSKVDATVTAAPTAVSDDLTYNKDDQDLFNPGSSDTQLMYLVTTTSDKPTTTDGFDDTIEKKADAGTYYLWYYAAGDDNHNDGDILPAEGTISKTIVPVTGVIVTITGATTVSTYNDQYHTAEGYEIESISNPLYEAGDFNFSGNASASRLEAGTTHMGLQASDFSNNNTTNFPDVTFDVTDGYVTINPISSVTVTITGATKEVTYDGDYQSVDGYTAEADNELYSCDPTDLDFTFNGNDVVGGTNAGTYNMNLAATDFTNTNSNFATVNFVIDADGKLTIKPKDLTITANAQTITYGDDISSAPDDVDVDGLVNGDQLTSITLSKTATDYSADPYIGNITASDAVITREEATVTGNYNITYASGDLTILKAASSVTTAPTPVGDLTYNGTAWQLFNAGSVTGGTMMYRVTTTDEPLENTDEVKATFSETIEQKADVGTYYLWYYVKGDANHDDTSVTFAGVNEIHMATNTISGTPTINGWTYGEDANSPSGCTATFGTVVYKYNNAHDGTYGTYDDVVKGNAGEWFVKAFVEGTDNYTAAESEATQFNIHKAAPAVTAPTPVDDELTYNGTARQLFNAGSVTGGTMKYLLTTTPDKPDETDEVKATFSETIEQQADAGTYYLWYYVKGDANHDDTFVTSAGVKEIKKADLTVTITGNHVEVPYNGVNQSVEGYTVEIGTDLYSNQDFTFSGDASAGGMNASDDPYYMDLRVSQFTNNNSNFDVVFNVTDGYLKINPKALTITAKEQTINYGDEISSTPGNVDVDGLVEGDALTAITLSKTATDYQADPYDDDITASEAIIKRGEATVTGNYTITYVNGDLTINKAASSVTTAPEPKNLEYTGDPQPLVDAGEAAGGTLVYSLEENGAYSADIPTATDAVEYTVYYKVAGDDNHNDTEPASVTANIAKATNAITGTLTIGDWSYGEEANSPSGCTAAFGDIVYMYSNSYDEGYGTYDAIVGGHVGAWYVKAHVDETDNYAGAESEPTSFTINTADPIASNPTVVDDSFTYDGTAKTLFNAGSVKGGTIKYYVTTTNEPLDDTAEVRALFTTTIPQQTNAGNYYLWYYVEGNDNYYGVPFSSVGQKEIHKATNEITGTPNTNSWTYGEQANSPEGCNATFGDIVYMYSNAHNGTYGTYDAVVGGNAGTWFVKAHVEGTDNYDEAWSNPAQFTIEKVHAEVTDEPRVEDGTITYNGYEQQLFNSGSAEGGTMKYLVTTTNVAPTTTEGFSDDIPQQTNAGTYYLWYYVEGDNNHIGIGIQLAGTKTIAKADGEVTLSLFSVDFGQDGMGSQKTFNVTGNTSGGELSVTSTNTNVVSATIDSNGVVTLTRQTDDSAYETITVTSAATANYKAASATCPVNLDRVGGLE